QGDLTGEGTVDLDDFVILKNNFGTAAAVDVMIDDVLGAGPLMAITEINYHPYDPSPAELAAGFTDANLFEFIELTNIGASSFNVAGCEFTKGIDYVFPSKVLAPGQRIIIVANLAAFRARYGAAIPVLGTFTGALSSSGEQILLRNSAGLTMVNFVYEDGGDWPGRPDGKGSTLEVIDPRGDYNDPDNWRPSAEWHGTPGSAGAGEVVDVVVNEVLAHTDEPAVDAIELHNTTGAAIDISGWYLSDDSDDYLKYRIPAGTVIPAGGYVVFYATQFGSAFGLSATGDDVWVLAADATGKLTRFVDHVEFLASHNSESLGRYPNATGRLYPMLNVTLGAANSEPRVGPLILTEVLYAPTTPTAAHLEFVEIHNPTGLPVDLTNWALDKDVEYVFPAGTILPAGGTLVVTSFDPALAANATLLNTFRTTYGIDASVAMVGGWIGQLPDADGHVQLLRPDEPDPADPTVIPYFLEDEVRYDSAAPWPAASGLSLQRVAADLWGNDSASWAAEGPTPGTFGGEAPKPGDINLDGAVDLDDFVILKQNFGAAG
ncbi:MAG: lamin tail domain-containing protein, partial [Planctomycetes bacterium]|nr:lamin tail domain-containing protein [Planctomycetota bacterium]